MGKEVADWQLSEAELAFTLRLPRTAEGKVNVALPWEKVTILCDENLVEYVQPVAGVYQFSVTLNGFAHIRIQKG
jgi:hypothetical protein